MMLLANRLCSKPCSILLGLSFLFVLLLVASWLAFFKPAEHRLVAMKNDELLRERSVALAALLASEGPSVLPRARANGAGDGAHLGLSNPVVELLTRNARQRGLDLDLVEPGPVESIGQRLILPVSVNLSGSYVDFVNWLRDVESSDILVTVDRLRLEGTPTGRHQFHVEMSVYSYSHRE